MYTFAQQPKTPPSTASTQSPLPGRSHLAQTPAENATVELKAALSPRLGHSLRSIPLHPSAGGVRQTKLAINEPGDGYEQEADRVAEQVRRMPEPPRNLSPTEDELL